MTCNFQSKRGREMFSTRANACSASLQTKFEKEAVDNAVDSAHSVCRRVRCAVLRIRFWGRRKWPQASRILGDGCQAEAIGFTRHFATLPIHVAPSLGARLRSVVSRGPNEGATTHHQIFTVLTWSDRGSCQQKSGTCVRLLVPGVGGMG